MSTRLPDVTELGHGIGVVPVPLPIDSPPWVNAYVVRGDDRIVLIDCGMDWEVGARHLMEGLGALGCTPGDIDTLIVSHMHPDHVGMAPRMTREHGWKLLMHQRASSLYERYNDTPERARWTDAFVRRHGTPPALIGEVADIGPRPDWMPILDPPDIAVMDGDMIDLGGRSLEVLHTPGHEQTHICLRDSRTGILFSGDHVLPRITPIIMFDEDAEDVLGDYLGSLERLISLEIGLTYPAHGWIVERGTARSEQIILHHDRRLEGMLDVVRRGPTTAWTVMVESYRPNLPPNHQRMALLETVSHLEHLRVGDRLRSFDEAGVLFYRR